MHQTYLSVTWLPSPLSVAAHAEFLLAMTGELGALPTLLAVRAKWSGRESFFAGDDGAQFCCREREGENVKLREISKYVCLKYQHQTSTY